MLEHAAKNAAAKAVIGNPDAEPLQFLCDEVPLRHRQPLNDPLDDVVRVGARGGLENVSSQLLGEFSCHTPFGHLQSQLHNPASFDVEGKGCDPAAQRG
mmetsp:Transcript_83737/g.194804  ORF Transcript_83737/g.194804 Transcript_83737/m.194804 type:complete len:99 (+) Transcript_83737:549-845(+)